MRGLTRLAGVSPSIGELTATRVGWVAALSGSMSRRRFWLWHRLVNIEPVLEKPVEKRKRSDLILMADCFAQFVVALGHQRAHGSGFRRC